jgi:hypothetical protein
VCAGDCDALPAGSARANCYFGLSRAYCGQSDVAIGNARVQSDEVRLAEQEKSLCFGCQLKTFQNPQFDFDV